MLTKDELDEIRSRQIPGVINNTPLTELILHHDYRFPLVLPGDWRVLEQRKFGYCYGKNFGLSVIAAITSEKDEKKWLHLAVHHPRHKPTWEELEEVHSLFARGRQMFFSVPEFKRYTLQSVNAVNMWTCLDGEPLPDFSHGKGLT